MATATNTSGTVVQQLSFTEVITAGVISTLNLPAILNDNFTYGNGTSAGNVDYIYAKSLSLAGSATTLDLTSLTDLNGGSVNFARVRELVIVNLATTAAYTVTAEPGVSNPWTTGPWGTSTSTTIIPTNVGATGNYSFFRFVDRYTVGATTGAYVDGTHKTIKLDPGANTISVYVLILGCSAVS